MSAIDIEKPASGEAMLSETHKANMSGVARTGRLGVIACGGALPRLVAEAERRAGGEVFIVAVRGAAERWIQEWPHVWSGLGQAGRIFGSLKNAGCDRVCFAGAIRRPSFFNLMPDLTGLVVATRVFRLFRKGDDGLLRGLAEMFEERGFRLIGANEMLGDQLAPAGALSRREPTAADLRDIARAAEIVRALGSVDVGQGAVVAEGRCLAVEAVQGTDAMLAALKGETRRGGAKTPAGVIYKAPKPGQDLRLDLPTIGPNTIAGAKAAGLNGVAVEAGKAFMLGIDETVRAADAAGLFVYGWRGAEEELE